MAQIQNTRNNTTNAIQEEKMETYSAGEDVSLSEKYYTDTKATVLEVPRFGWKVTSVEDGIATIEYQRPNWKLLMTIICEVTYLQRES